MKASIITVALAAGLVSAQSEKVPECARECIAPTDSNGQIDGCGQFDLKCICSNESFLDNIACCVAEVCDEAGQKSAIKAASEICSVEGIETPTEVKCSKDSDSDSSDDDKDDDKKEDDKKEDEDSSNNEEESEESNDNEDAASALFAGMKGAVAAGVAMLFAL